MMNNEYYVYFFLRQDGTPYYIGKGRGKRAYRKDAPPEDRILLVLQNLTEEQAFSNEKNFISWYGRKDTGTGILRNLTDGGEGVSGRKLSEETKNKIRKSCKGFTPEMREKIRISLIGCKQSKDTIEKRKVTMLERYGGPINKGVSPSDEVKVKISKTLTGRKQSQSTVEKRILSNKGKKRSKEFCQAMKDRQTGVIKVKYSVELIETIIREYNNGATKSALHRKYSIDRNRIREIIKAPDLYKCNIGQKWVNNGKETKKLKQNQEIPDGWIRGHIDIKKSNTLDKFFIEE